MRTNSARLGTNAAVLRHWIDEPRHPDDGKTIGHTAALTNGTYYTTVPTADPNYYRHIGNFVNLSQATAYMLEQFAETHPDTAATLDQEDAAPCSPG